MGQPVKSPPLTEVQQRLLFHNRGVAYRIARDFLRCRPLARRIGDLDDMAQEILLHLGRFLDHYRPELGTYTTWAYTVGWRHLDRLVWIRGLVSVPSGSRSLFRDPVLMSRRDREKALCVRRALACESRGHTHERGPQTRDNGAHDPIRNDDAIPDCRGAGPEPDERLPAALAQLDQRQQFILTRRFGLDGGVEQTLEEVGLSIGLSKERTRQIQQAALRKLAGLLDSPQV